MQTNEINIPLYQDAGFSTDQMRSLQKLLVLRFNTGTPIHWLFLNPSTGIYELTLDNQMMKTFRACPAHFMESYVEGWGGTGRSWNLEFGILFHKMMEIYYKEFRSSGFILQDWAIKRGIEEWNKAQMDFHIGHKEYQSIGGVHGFVGLLISYATRFDSENERLRIIGTEIGFGKKKEVRLGQVPNFDVLNPHFVDPFLDCYLSGRIDVLVDDGTSICPMDHKTKGSLRYDPTQEFELDEGPTGYIYAIKNILPQFLSSAGLSPDLLRRDCNKIIMNFISKSIPKEGDRYKRLPIRKTEEQLESYRKRMLATCEDIFKAVVRYAHTKVAYRNTERCTNLYMRDCDFLAVHRQNSKENELAILNQFFVRKSIWDTETANKE